MAGTMTKQELRIGCGTTNNASVKTIPGYSNMAAMTTIGSTMYLAKSHKNVNSAQVFKSVVLKSTNFESASATIGDTNDAICYLDYFVFGMTAVGSTLYLTCQKSANEYGIVKVNTDGTNVVYTKLTKAFVGIAKYSNTELILMEAVSGTDASILKCRRVPVNNLAQTNAEFTIKVNDSADYRKVNGIHYSPTYGLFVLTNHYVTNYSGCKNRILLVKPLNYANGDEYSPYAVFEANLSTTEYKQYNFEGITLYKKNMWVVANVVAATGKPALLDKVAHQGGVTFDGPCFSFNGSTQTGAAVKNSTVNGVICTGLQGMAMNKGDAYCLKCDGTNQYASLFKTSTPESGTATKIRDYQGTTCLYHSNGLTYNYDDKKLYAACYKGNTIHNITVLDLDGRYEKKHEINESQYGISYYGNNQFILMNKLEKFDVNKDNRLKFNKAVLNSNSITVNNTKFYADYGRESDDVLQDIFYSSSYGLFFPVCKLNDKLSSANAKYYPKTILYHIAKDDIQSVMDSGTSKELKPDFAIVLDKNPNSLKTTGNYTKYEIESMDIDTGTKRMTMNANIDIVGSSNKDSFQILKTLTFI